jgi:hypothetical protein
VRIAPRFAIEQTLRNSSTGGARYPLIIAGARAGGKGEAGLDAITTTPGVAQLGAAELD